jgi:membrane-associated phospholipid phosphatase
MNLFGDAWVALLLLLLAERRAGYMTSWILKIWLMGAFIVQTIKYVFPMPRPAAILGAEHLSLIDTPPLVASSMPSGHALAAISCGFVLMLLLQIRGFRKSYLFAVGVASVVAAWSRVAVGAHWPADVIAGAGLAVLVLVLSTLWEQRNGWNQWFEKSGGLFFLIVLHLLIALHLLQPQSKLFIVQMIQLCFSVLSIFRAFLLFKKYLRNSSLMHEEKS